MKKFNVKELLNKENSVKEKDITKVGIAKIMNQYENWKIKIILILILLFIYVSR